MANGGEAIPNPGLSFPESGCRFIGLLVHGGALNEPRNDKLLDAIMAFELDDPGAQLPFTARLAREQGWTHVFAGRVVTEYKRFVVLAMLAGHPVTPSEEVDQAWHLHLVYTRSYWQGLCRDVLGRELHHGVFDWKGPDFLWFYAAAFVAALVWSLLRRARATEKFSLPEAVEVELTDPYELAYLAGGAPRCTQVVVVRLIRAGAVEWKKAKLLGESKLVATGKAEPDLNDIERTVYSSVLGYGKKGMPLTSLPLLVGTRLSGIESKLAKLGLRPTQSEEGGRGCFIALPLLILALFGVVKVIIGLSRDKPVAFLFGFLIVTVLAMVFIAAARKKLTPAGERMLENMRGGSCSSLPDPTL